MPVSDISDHSAVPPGAGMKIDTRFEHMPEQSRVLIDATMKWPYPPVALPKREFMEKARALWEELGLTPLKLREPWWGQNLGCWSDEEEEQANLAVKGEYYKTGEVQARRRRSI